MGHVCKESVCSPLLGWANGIWSPLSKRSWGSCCAGPTCSGNLGSVLQSLLRSPSACSGTEHAPAGTVQRSKQSLGAASRTVGLGTVRGSEVLGFTGSSTREVC